MTHISGRRRWRPRTRKNPPPARPPDPDAATQDGPAEAASIQLAIGLLTASLDSPQLEAWAAQALIPEDPVGLAGVVVGLHLVNLLLLEHVYAATGQPPSATLQKLAILAAAGPEMPFTG